MVGAVRVVEVIRVVEVVRAVGVARGPNNNKIITHLMTMPQAAGKKLCTFFSRSLMPWKEVDNLRANSFLVAFILGLHW